MHILLLLLLIEKFYLHKYDPIHVKLGKCKKYLEFAQQVARLKIFLQFVKLFQWGANLAIQHRNIVYMGTLQQTSDEGPCGNIDSSGRPDSHIICQIKCELVEIGWYQRASYKPPCLDLHYFRSGHGTSRWAIRNYIVSVQMSAARLGPAYRDAGGICLNHLQWGQGALLSWRELKYVMTFSLTCSIHLICPV